MHEWLGWVFIGLGVAFILIEVILRIFIILKRKTKPTATESGIPDIIVELIKKLPWMVIVGFILIYLGLCIIGASIPIEIKVG